MTNKKDILERLGMGLSLLCAVHCLVTPLFIAFLPIVSSKMIHNPAFESVLLGSSFFIVGLTNLIGFLQHHKKWQPIILMLLAISVILTGHFIHSAVSEIICSSIGGGLLAYSVYVNQQQRKIALNKQCYCSDEQL